ncbi:hypothetical protein HPP92_021414 [Vanilla planifolia]|uniref:Uncharacterized protein n=1 Tax=Vanilla planifolia TaxID=51239 RepID=A0A835Q119_VANPL|nr:hypothetical protein HPP92_021414 [Vanilla planifolia]
MKVKIALQDETAIINCKVFVEVRSEANGYHVMLLGNGIHSGKLIDAYRFLHKEKDMERGFTWSGNPIGKYRGKRMRIDYFIVSEQLKERIVSCDIHGYGIELEGFCGSDHCPVSLELSQTT